MASGTLAAVIVWTLLQAGKVHFLTDVLCSRMSVEYGRL